MSPLIVVLLRINKQTQDINIQVNIRVCVCATLLLFSRFFRLEFCFFLTRDATVCRVGATVIFSRQQGRLSVLCLKCSIKSINQVERPSFLFGFKIRTRSTKELLTRLIHTRTHSHTHAHLATRDLRKKEESTYYFLEYFFMCLLSLSLDLL